jgi:hypothetical protein
MTLPPPFNPAELATLACMSRLYIICPVYSSRRFLLRRSAVGVGPHDVVPFSSNRPQVR